MDYVANEGKARATITICLYSGELADQPCRNTLPAPPFCDYVLMEVYNGVNTLGMQIVYKGPHHLKICLVVLAFCGLHPMPHDS